MFKSDWQPIREKFDALANQREPAYLYHYTTLESFAKIVESRTMRATHRYYLNDPDDLLHGMQFCETVAGGWVASAVGRQHELGKLVLTKLAEHRSEFDDSPFTFSVSFSERKEGAAQWQVYGDYGRGVMIVFNFEKLKQSLLDTESFTQDDPMKITRAHFILSKTIYQQEAKKDDILSLLEVAWQCLQKAEDIFPVSAIERAARPTAYFLSLLATRSYKQDAFDFEMEWRAVPYISRSGLIEFDIRRDSVRPFIPMAFDVSCVEEVVIGSAVKDPYIEKTTALLLEKLRVGYVRVSRSSVKLVPPAK